MDVRSIGKLILIFLWLATLVAAAVWVFVKTPPFDPEPITVVLGLISAGLTGFLNHYETRLTQEEYSTPFALAYGYVNNFIEPVITHFISKGEDPKLNVFLPDDLTELEPKNIERVMGFIRKKFKSETVTLELNEGRVRDIIALHQDQSQKTIFDFPTTLLTLNSLVDFKSESKRDSFSTQKKKELGSVYIGKFREAVTKLLKEKKILSYIQFVDAELNPIN